jgi:hypothetical protein
MISDNKKVFAIFGAVLSLVGPAVVVAKLIGADVSTALRAVGFSLIAVGVLIFIIVTGHFQSPFRRRHR